MRCPDYEIECEHCTETCMFHPLPPEMTERQREFCLRLAALQEEFGMIFCEDRETEESYIARLGDGAHRVNVKGLGPDELRWSCGAVDPGDAPALGKD